MAYDKDRSIHRNVVWDGETNCDSPREGYLWDLDIAVMLCTFGWHLVWKMEIKVVVLGGAKRKFWRSGPNLSRYGASLGGPTNS